MKGSKSAILAGLLAMASSSIPTEMIEQIESIPEPSSPRPPHKPHQGAKERARRLKQRERDA